MSTDYLEEPEEVLLDDEYPQEDIALVAEQSNCSLWQAKKTLKKTHGDIVDAVMLLTKEHTEQQNYEDSKRAIFIHSSVSSDSDLSSSEEDEFWKENQTDLSKPLPKDTKDYQYLRKAMKDLYGESSPTVEDFLNAVKILGKVIYQDVDSVYISTDLTSEPITKEQLDEQIRTGKVVFKDDNIECIGINPKSNSK